MMLRNAQTYGFCRHIVRLNGYSKQENVKEIAENKGELDNRVRGSLAMMYCLRTEVASKLNPLPSINRD